MLYSYVAVFVVVVLLLLLLLLFLLCFFLPFLPLSPSFFVFSFPFIIEHTCGGSEVNEYLFTVGSLLGQWGQSYQ